MADKICRTCLKVVNVDDGFTSLRSEGQPIDVLRNLIVDFDAEIVSNAILCNSCISLLQLISLYREVCLESEEKISVYRRRLKLRRKLIEKDLLEAATIDLSLPKQCNRKEDTNKDHIKTENIKTEANESPVNHISSTNNPSAIVNEDTPNVTRKRNTRSRKKTTKCPICEKQFAVTNHKFKHLKQSHLVTHPSRPFLCDLCPKGFKRKTHLVRHTYVHTGEKPFECETCRKKFTRMEHLTSHLKMCLSV